MGRHGIAVGYRTGAVGHALVIDVALSWPAGASAADGRAAETLRDDLALLWGAFGAIHFGVGKTYAYAEALSSAALGLIQALKAAVDPRGLMNPGALGLGGGGRPNTPSKYSEFPQNLLEETYR